MKNSVDVSIIIIAHNRQELFDRCLNAVEACEMEFSKEIVVVDDRSTPPLKVTSENVRLFSSDHLPGPSGARNKGATEAVGSYLFFIDSDIEVDTKGVLELYTSVRAQNIDAVFGMFALKKQNRRGNFYSEYKNMVLHYKALCTSKKSFLINTSIFAIKKDLWRDIGGFNEESQIGEDIEIGQALRKHRKVVFLNKNIRAIHNKSFSGIKELLVYHFSNVVNGVQILMSGKDSKDPAQHNQLRFKLSLVLTPLIALAVMLTALIPTMTNFAVLCSLVSLFYFLNRNMTYLFYCERGVNFSIRGLGMYYLESLVAFFGSLFAMGRFYLVKNIKLNYRLRF